MTDETINNDDTVTDAEESDAEEPTESTDTPAEPTPEATDDVDRSVLSRRRWTLAAAVLAVVVIAGALSGYVKYTGVTDELAALRQADADRSTAEQLAKDYAMKSLTYSFEDPDAFFRAVEDGVSPTLKDKYVNARDLLKGVMLEAQVTSSGEVLATDATAQPGNVYQVVVSAAQTTRNVQNPTPRVSTILLQIIVNKVGDTWQVSDIGPKTGTRAPDASGLPPAKP